MAEDTKKPQNVLPGPLRKDSQAPAGAERRIAPRFPFTAAAEVVELQSQTRVAGRSADLGSGGCYIDTMSPCPVGAVVRVRLESNMRQFEAIAVVTYALVSMGMGMSFTDIKPEHQAVLRDWIAELSGEKPAISEVDSTSSEQGMLAAISNNRQVLNEIINLLVRKKIISENEAAALLRTMFR